MRIRSLAVVLLLTLYASSASTAASKTCWYHPKGSACPTYPDNDVQKANCEKENHKPCVRSCGSAAPAC
jgi:hypothetical protein